MNKLAVSLVLVAMFVGVASANLLKKGHKHHGHEELLEDYEPEFGHHHKLGHQKHKHLNHDDEEYGHNHLGHHHGRPSHHGHHHEECKHCGHHELGHHEHGHHEHGHHELGHHEHGLHGLGHHDHGHHELGHHELGHHGHHELGHHEHEHKRGHGLKGKGKLGLKGELKHSSHSKARSVGAGAGIAVGGEGFRNRKELDAGVHTGKHIGAHKLAEGQKSFIAGKNKKFLAGKNRHDVHDAEGHNRHSGFNKDKLIVKEHEDGFKGDVGFHNHDEHSDSAHIGGSQGKFIAGKKGGRISSSKDIESEHDAGIHAGSETEAGIGGGLVGGAVDFE